MSMTVRRKWLIELPHVENLHTSIHAYLRTSEYGSWEPDPSIASDSFVMNYRRGEELPRPPGKVAAWWACADAHNSAGSHSYRYEEYLAHSGWPGSRPPLRLRVVLRPSRDGIRVGIEWEMSSRYEALFMSFKGDALSAEMEDELRSLAEYLAEYCGLPELPRLLPDEST